MARVIADGSNPGDPQAPVLLAVAWILCLICGGCSGSARDGLTEHVHTVYRALYNYAAEHGGLPQTERKLRDYARGQGVDLPTDESYEWRLGSVPPSLETAHGRDITIVGRSLRSGESYRHEFSWGLMDPSIWCVRYEFVSIAGDVRSPDSRREVISDRNLSDLVAEDIWLEIQAGRSPATICDLGFSEHDSDPAHFVERQVLERRPTFRLVRSGSKISAILVTIGREQFRYPMTGPCNRNSVVVRVK